MRKEKRVNSLQLYFIKLQSAIHSFSFIFVLLEIFHHLFKLFYRQLAYLTP